MYCNCTWRQNKFSDICNTLRSQYWQIQNACHEQRLHTESTCTSAVLLGSQGLCKVKWWTFCKRVWPALRKYSKFIACKKKSYIRRLLTVKKRAKTEVLLPSGKRFEKWPGYIHSEMQRSSNYFLKQFFLLFFLSLWHRTNSTVLQRMNAWNVEGFNVILYIKWQAHEWKFNSSQ